MNDRTVNWRVAVGVAMTILLISLGIVFIALTVYDRYGPEPPRQIQLSVTAETTRLNAENLCDFASATADALKALSQTFPDLTADQEAAIDEMVTVAHRCRAAP